MSHKQRFLIIVWPDDHDEGDLAEHACDIQDAIDTLGMGGAKVIAPIPGYLNEACAEHLKDVF